MPPTLDVRPATADDVAQCGRTLERAFVADPVMRYLFPDDEQYAAVAPTVFRNIARRCLATQSLMQSLWCSPDGVAFACWRPPADTASVDAAFEPEPLDPSLVAPERFEALREVTTANLPPEPHWYLRVLGTHPDWQGQGYGAALMSVVFAVADRDHIPCYLETETVDLVAYYRRHGFEVRTEWDVALDGPHMWGMWRPPRPVG